MNQVTEDKAHLCAAHHYAQRLSRCERLKVCCLFVRGRSVLSLGVNGMPPGASNCCEDEQGNSKPEVQHAEDNAILAAAKAGISLQGAAVYLTHAPCLRCAAKLAGLEVERVVYDAIYRDLSGVDYLKKLEIPVEKIEWC